VSTSAIYSKNKQFYLDRLNISKEYIFPNLDKLSLIEAFSVLVHAKRLKYLIEKGVNQKNFAVSRLYRLIDPLSWAEIPPWIVRHLKSIKMNKEIFGKGDLK